MSGACDVIGGRASRPVSPLADERVDLDHEHLARAPPRARAPRTRARSLVPPARFDHATLADASKHFESRNQLIFGGRCSARLHCSFTIFGLK